MICLRLFLKNRWCRQPNLILKSFSTVANEEVSKFSELSKHWWDKDGHFAALHALNDLRVPLIRDVLTQTAPSPKIASRILERYDILDAGCGGGILCEALARLGASVLGVDASQESVDIAREHCRLDSRTADSVEYVCSRVEDVVRLDRQFDAVVASEVVEHVENVPEFLSFLCDLVKPGGSLIFTTINRTRLSYWLAVIAAENILSVTPPGSHDWYKFISPEELQFELSRNGCRTHLVHGMLYNPLTRTWSWSALNSVNYALHAIKDPND